MREGILGRAGDGRSPCQRASQAAPQADPVGKTPRAFLPHCNWGGRRMLAEILSSLSRHQNRRRTVPVRDLGPPVCRMGDSPLPGLLVPSIKFYIEVDWPNTALLRNFTGSPKLAWFSALKASRSEERRVGKECRSRW